MANENQNLILKPPVVVVMGHVDHGKSSILDYIRKTNITEKEAGGITQQLGAYEVIHNNSKITFLDTPGHVAFNTIRERGTIVADIAILVIAADEGIKAQTEEALNLILNQNLPFIIACNKIDRPEANSEKVKQELAEKGVYVESYGGKIPSVNVSAKTGEGIEELLDLILILNELNNKKIDPNSEPFGYILESGIDARKGINATCLVLEGKIKVGDLIYTATSKAKVKILENFLGKPIKEALPSSPVRVIGWENQPLVGEKFSTNIEKVDKIEKSQAKTFEELKSIEQNENILKLILKADVSGSLEALEKLIVQTLKEWSQEFEIISKSIGEINLNDLRLAETTKALIVAFRTNVSKESKNYLQSRDIKILTDEIIYKLKENLELFLKNKNQLPYKIIAEAEVLQIFSQKDKKDRQIIGCQLSSGKISKNSKFAIFRNDEEVGSGKIISIRKNKDELNEAEAVVELGLQIESSFDILSGDVLKFRIK